VRAGEMARERGLRFIGLSEVYPFNDWNEDRRAAVAGPIETAQAAGAETVSFIPRVDGREGDGAPSEQKRSEPSWPRSWRCSMGQGSSA
jgi:predicted xylose isomerase-like sugar epimerase